MENKMESERYILDGVSHEEAQNGRTLSGEEVVLLRIDNNTFNQLHQLVAEFIYSFQLIYNAKFYATTRTLYEKRKKIISNRNLVDNELLILLLIAVAPWTNDDGIKKRERAQFHEDTNPDIEYFMQSLNIFNKIRLNRSQGKTDEYGGKWKFDSFKITFKHVSDESKKFILPDSNLHNHNKYFLHLMCDYLELIEKEGFDLRTRIENAPGHVETDWKNIDISQYPQENIFFVNFIDFLKSTPKLNRTSYNQLYMTYICLLDEAGFVLHSNITSPREKVLQKRYKDWKERVTGSK